MSRETYFRAWDKITKQYYAVKSLEYDDDGNLDEVYLAGIKIDESDPNANVRKPSEVILEQDTGLKDKNGKKICDGDIVEASIDGVWAAGNAVCFGKKKWKLEVIYNDIRFMDVFRIIGSKNAPDRIYYLFDKELSELEVIGNIHENGELLEAKNVD